MMVRRGGTMIGKNVIYFPCPENIIIWNCILTFFGLFCSPVCYLRFSKHKRMAQESKMVVFLLSRFTCSSNELAEWYQRLSWQKHAKAAGTVWKTGHAKYWCNFKRKWSHRYCNRRWRRRRRISTQGKNRQGKTCQAEEGGPAAHPFFDWRGSLWYMPVRKVKV